MVKLIMKFSKFIYWGCILTIFIVPCFLESGMSQWTQSKEFEMLGVQIQLYFTPEPGRISIDRDNVKGIVVINRTNNDYTLSIDIWAYGTIQGNGPIYPNPAGSINTTIYTSHNYYMGEVLLETPQDGNFTAYMVITFIWLDQESELDNRTELLAANYQKISNGFDLASIVFHIFEIGLELASIGGVIIFFVGAVMSYRFIRKKYQEKSIDTASVNKKLEQIIQRTRVYISGSGNFKEFDLSGMDSSRKPGDIGRLRERKKQAQKKLSKLRPRLKELKKIEDNLEKEREPIVTSDLFKFISSYFIRASRKRELFPDDDIMVWQVQKIRDSLQKGNWDELKDLEKVKLTWNICDKYVKSDETHKEPPLRTDFDIDKEADVLANMIMNYLEIQKNTQWPPDMEIVFRTKDDLLMEIKIIDRLIEKFSQLNKSQLKKYVRECLRLKKETQNDMKWLESMNEIIDENIAKRLTNRLQKINDLMEQDIKFTKSLL